MTKPQAHALAEKIADRLLETGLVKETSQFLIQINGTSSNSPTTLHDSVRDSLFIDIVSVLERERR